MEVLFLMILASVSLGLAFLILFLIGAKKGQFDDNQSPAVRMLEDPNSMSQFKEIEKLK